MPTDESLKARPSGGSLQGNRKVGYQTTSNPLRSRLADRCAGPGVELKKVDLYSVAENYSVFCHLGPYDNRCLCSDLARDQRCSSCSARESFGLARRDALWAIEALRDEPLALFAAAAAAADVQRRGR